MLPREPLVGRSPVLKSLKISSPPRQPSQRVNLKISPYTLQLKSQFHKFSIQLLMESFTAAIQGLMTSVQDFPLKLKQRLLRESSNVVNPVKFIAGLITGGVLKDDSSDSEVVQDSKEMMVHSAIRIASAKGADGVGELLKALEGSGNIELVSALRTWVKENYGVQTDGELSEPTEGASVVVLSPAAKQLPKNDKSPTDFSSTGIKLLDQITSCLEDDFTEKLEGHLVGKASKVVQVDEFSTSLVLQNVLEQNETQRTTGPQGQERKLAEKAIKAACSKKAIGSLVHALQSSNNERILVEAIDWIETTQVRKKNCPIAVKSLQRQPRTTETGLFVATARALIYLNLRTSVAAALTRKFTLAVAVNHNLSKVYWSQNFPDSCIMRSNFDGSAKEVIVPAAGDWIHALAIDEAAGNVYYALYQFHQIKVCNALGENQTVVLSNSPLVNFPASIAVNSIKRLLYWSNRPSLSRHSIVRSDLDGRNAAIISCGFEDLRGMTLGQSSNDVIYWVDMLERTIGTVDVNGGNKRIIVKLDGNSAPYGIQVDPSKIYFSRSKKETVESVDRDSGADLTAIFNSTTGAVNHLLVFNAPMNQS